MYGSGSTWAYNLARGIAHGRADQITSLYADHFAALPALPRGFGLLLLKCHRPDAPLQQFLAEQARGRLLLTVRDPRDAVVSLLQRFPNMLSHQFDNALEWVAASAAALVPVAQQPGAKVLRYEDRFIGSTACFDQVAAMLRASPSQQQRQNLLEDLSPEGVRRTIRHLEATGSIRGEACPDLQTHWHANHVRDGQVGKYADYLTRAQEAEVLQRTTAYRRHFGY